LGFGGGAAGGGLGGTALEDLDYALGVDAEAIVCGAGVEEAVARADPGTYCDGCGALEYGLRGFVVVVPRLVLVVEEERYTFEVDFPS